jgi:hypothetical protein
MNTLKTASAVVSVAVGLMLTCCASEEPVTNQPVVPETQTPRVGVTATQAIADEEVILRISSARCDRSQSCNHIGPGAVYRNRDVCMEHMRALVATKLNTTRCPGGIGEVGVARCVKSLQAGECDMPGQEYPTADHCKVKDMCLE